MAEPAVPYSVALARKLRRLNPEFAKQNRPLIGVKLCRQIERFIELLDDDITPDEQELRRQLGANLASKLKGTIKDCKTLRQKEAEGLIRWRTNRSVPMIRSRNAPCEVTARELVRRDSDTIRALDDIILWLESFTRFVGRSPTFWQRNGRLRMRTALSNYEMLQVLVRERDELELTYRGLYRELFVQQAAQRVEEAKRAGTYPRRGRRA